VEQEGNRSLEIDARLCRLECELRRWRMLAALGPIALLVVAVTGSPLSIAGTKPMDAFPRSPSPGSPVVEAQRFVLRDAAGATRVTLALAEDGLPLLTFFDGDGEPQAALGPRHLYLSGDGNTAVKLLVNPGGTPALRLEKQGRLRAVLGMANDGTLALGFYGQDGKGRALLDVAADGSPGLTLFHKSGKVWSAP
jgi:hypothetical protein